MRRLAGLGHTSVLAGKTVAKKESSHGAVRSNTAYLEGMAIKLKHLPRSQWQRSCRRDRRTALCFLRQHFHRGVLRQRRALASLAGGERRFCCGLAVAGGGWRRTVQSFDVLDQ